MDVKLRKATSPSVWLGQNEMRKHTPGTHRGDTPYFQLDWMGSRGERDNTKTRRNIYFLAPSQHRYPTEFSPLLIREFICQSYDDSAREVEKKMMEQLYSSVPRWIRQRVGGKWGPERTYRSTLHFLSPGRGIHFCQITVIVSNGTVVIAQRRRRREEEGGGGGERGVENMGCSHSFNHSL